MEETITMSLSKYQAILAYKEKAHKMHSEIKDYEQLKKNVDEYKRELDLYRKQIQAIEAEEGAYIKFRGEREWISFYSKDKAIALAGKLNEEVRKEWAEEKEMRMKFQKYYSGTVEELTLIRKKIPKWIQKLFNIY